MFPRYAIMLKDIKKKITPTAVFAFILIVILAGLLFNKNDEVKRLQTNLENSEAGITSLEAEYLNSITLLEKSIEDYENELYAIAGRLIESEKDTVIARDEITELRKKLQSVELELNVNITALNDALEKPNCPVVPTE